METLGDVLSYIDDLLPNNISTARKIQIINNETFKLSKYLTSTNLHDITSIATTFDSYVYSLPSTSFEFTDISKVFIDNSTISPTSTDYDGTWSEYTYLGQDDEITGNHYYNHLGSLGIVPATTVSGYHIRVMYRELPVTFDSTANWSVQFNFEQNWVDIVKFRTMARIAKSGNAPDIMLANGYEADANEIEKRMKMDMAKIKAKQPSKMWSYKSDWE